LEGLNLLAKGVRGARIAILSGDARSFSGLHGQVFTETTAGSAHKAAFKLRENQPGAWRD